MIQPVGKPEQVDSEKDDDDGENQRGDTDIPSGCWNDKIQVEQNICVADGE